MLSFPRSESHVTSHQFLSDLVLRKVSLDHLWSEVLR